MGFTQLPPAGMPARVNGRFRRAATVARAERPAASCRRLLQLRMPPLSFARDRATSFKIPSSSFVLNLFRNQHVSRLRRQTPCLGG
jgi:hypothetical protein